MSMCAANRGRALLALALTALVTGCAVGPDFVRPDAPSVTHYTSAADPTATVSADGTIQHFAPGATVAADWWRLFNSPKLSAIVEEATAHNPGLETAQASLSASQNQLRAGYGVFYPQLTGAFGANRQKVSPFATGETTATNAFSVFSLSGVVSYTLDIFGGQRRTVEGLAAQVDAQRATERATFLTLSSNIADAVIARAAYRAEIDATQQLIGLQREQVGVAKTQAQAGTMPYSNVLTLQSQLATYEATIPQLQQKLTQADDLLATLAGHTPAEWRPPDIALADLTLPRDLPVSLPSDLVRQRPDILLAEANAHAASASIGVATAAMLPSVTLNGSYGSSSNAISTLLASSSRFWTYGVDVATPLINGGSLWFQRKAAIDTYKQSMATYRQTVLTAFGQVADALHALDNDAATLRAQEEALSTSRQALQLVQANYRAGLTTYLDVLLADVQYHQAMVNELEAVAVRYQDSVALFAALGGGWWNGTPGPTVNRAGNAPAPK